jgi:hypothetical protein
MVLPSSILKPRDTKSTGSFPLPFGHIVLDRLARRQFDGQLQLPLQGLIVLHTLQISRAPPCRSARPRVFMVSRKSVPPDKLRQNWDGAGRRIWATLSFSIFPLSNGELHCCSCCVTVSYVGTLYRHVLMVYPQFRAKLLGDAVFFIDNSTQISDAAAGSSDDRRHDSGRV